MVPTIVFATVLRPIQQPQHHQRQPLPQQPLKKVQNAPESKRILVLIACARTRIATRAISTGVMVVWAGRKVQEGAESARTGAHCTTADARMGTTAQMLDAAFRATAISTWYAFALRPQQQKHLQVQPQRLPPSQRNASAPRCKMTQLCLRPSARCLATTCLIASLRHRFSAPLVLFTPMCFGLEKKRARRFAVCASRINTYIPRYDS